MSLQSAGAFLVLVFLYYLSSIISRSTKGKIPTPFASVIVMLLAFWTFLPKDIVQQADISGLVAFANFIVLVNVGSLFNLNDFKKDWGIAVMALILMAVTGALMFLLLKPLYGTEFVAAAYPVICGSLLATNIVSNALNEIGLPEIAGLMALLLSFQGMVAVPILSYGTRLECRRLLALYRSGEMTYTPDASKNTQVVGTEKKKLVDRAPKWMQTPEFPLLLLLFFSVVASWISSKTSGVTHGILGFAVVAMVVGMIARQFGLIQKNPMSMYGIEGFCMMLLLISVRGNLGSLTPASFVKGTLPLFLCLLIAAGTIFFVCVPVGKILFHYSRGICIAAGTGIFVGYPINYMTMVEVINAEAETPEEVEFLKDHIIQKVLVGALSSTSTTSIIIAGIMVALFLS